MVTVKMSRMAGLDGRSGAARAAAVLGTLVWLAAAGAAAQFTCSAEVNRQAVAPGEEIVLTVAATGNVGWSPDIRLPALEGVQIYGGGTSQRMSNVNGKSETSVTRTYYLRVDREDDFTVGPVRIVGNGSECATEPIDIRVSAGAGVPPADTGNRTQAPTVPTAPEDRIPSGQGQLGGDVFVTLDVDQTDIWLGQQVTLTFRYWKRVQPWTTPKYVPPRTEGFWREGLGSERNYQRVWQGRTYNVTEINYALFPTRVGELTIEPATLTFREDLFDRFFNSRDSRRGPRQLQTDPIRMRVRPLPTPQPAGFSGIVASHVDLAVDVDRDSVPRGEAVGLKITLDSDGFLKGFRGLDLPETPGARKHDAAESFTTTHDGSRVTGHVAVEKVLVPDEEGALRVPQIELAWFDVSRGTYRTARTPWRDVKVLPSDKPRQTGDSGFLRNEIARLGEDLAFIHPVPGRVRRDGGTFTGGPLWWTLLAAPLLLLAVFRLKLGRLTADRRDPAGRRRRLHQRHRKRQSGSHRMSAKSVHEPG